MNTLTKTHIHQKQITMGTKNRFPSEGVQKNNESVVHYWNHNNSFESVVHYWNSNTSFFDIIFKKEIFNTLKDEENELSD